MAAAKDEGGAWEFTMHACRFCGSRVLNKGDVFACSTCDAHTKGSQIGICGCGVHLGPVPKTAKQIEKMKMRARHPQAFQCIRNPDPKPINPSIILIAFASDT